MSGSYAGRRVVILGLARQGVALARHLAQHGADVVVSDLLPAGQLGEALDQLAGLSLEVVLGGHPSSLLDGADLFCLSGGVPADAPIVRQATARGIPLSNDSQIFLEECPATVIGITGSAGKTTTTAMLGEMCRQGHSTDERRIWVGGNIGRSMLPDLDEIGAGDLVVMELSSFQLEIMTKSTPVAAVLNLTPNHLDRHRTMKAYSAAKARLLQHQPADGIALLGQDDPGACGLQHLVRGRLRMFSLEDSVADGAFLRDNVITLRGPEGEQPVCRRDELRLLGQHNTLNALAAAALADSVGIPAAAIAEVARTFAGVEHRLELVRELAGVRWFDDSSATAPERMMRAIRSFDEPIVLLAGGRDKDLPWSEAAALIGERVRDLVLFGQAADLIRAQLDKAGVVMPDAQAGEPKRDHRRGRIVQVGGLAQAVKVAARLARPGDIVLLSPGGTSFDAYQDFVERGDHFQAMVREL
ncbi:MAG: UDP-N-acetylmuramoyl-L-alanine--D-glutamate ligase [Anaerolineales bacterium]|nr:UDP-N-acetylmuramoyl-L-alanine--D-glutamate ligase [Anaerolineales bacterium]